MYSKAQLALKYLRNYISASNSKGHGVHSPFVYDFIVNALNDERNFYSYSSIEIVRDQLLHDKQILTIEDFGAGSRVHKTLQRSVASIAKSSLKSKKFGQLLFRMVNYYQPKTILELGTSLGITTSYLASANPNARVITMEGSTEIADIANNTFSFLGLKNIEVVKGNFDITLLLLISNIPSIDFVFIDGNHRYEPTVRYFEQILYKCNDQSVIILDDIHWSKEMEDAWHSIQQHKEVTLTIDLFNIGIVLLKKEFKVKQHFSVRV